MNTKALITTLAVLGSTSSLAMASPAHAQAPVTVNARVSYGQAPVRDYPAPISRDHRFTPPNVVVRPVARPIVRPVIQPVAAYRRGGDWRPRRIVLADDLTYNAGEFRKDIVLEGRGQYNTVTLQEDGGCNFIKEVRVEFTDGAVQSIPVNQTLQPSQAMTFDLDGNNRAINRIFVYRADGDYGAIRTASGGEFTVTAA